ncbi:MAG: hypothetical protein AB7T03_03775 [Bacilli bacterium]
MKGFFKLIFGILIFLIIIVAVPVGIVYYQISDSRDEAPVELYTDDITMQSQISKMMARALESDQDEIYLAFNEEEINLLLFAAIRENFNENYYKTTSEADQTIKAMVLPDNIPVLGGKQAVLKHAYAKIEGNEVSVFVTADAFGIKSSINFGLTITENEGVFTFAISRLGIGKFNLFGVLGKMILSPIMKSMQITDMINEKITENNLPIVFNEQDFSFSMSKTDLGDFLVNLTASEEAGTQNELLGQLIGVLTGSDNDFFGLGVFEENNQLVFGARLDLTELKYDAITDGVPSYLLDYTDYETKMNILLTANSSDRFAIMNQFLLYGYGKLSAEDQTVALGLDFSGIGIASSNIASYLGLVNAPTVDLESNISNELYDELADLSDADITLDITEDLVNQLLYANGLVGLGYNSFYDDEGVNKTIYAGVEAIWLDIIDDKLGFKIIFNFNGRKISLFTNFTNTSLEGSKIDAEFDELRMGTIVFSDEMKTAILGLLQDSLGGSEMTVIGVVDDRLVIDSNTFLEEFGTEGSLADLLGIIKDEQMLTLDLTGATLDANGAISFGIDLSKIESTEDVSAKLLETSTPFDTTTFIENKTQTFVISSLAGTEQKIVFSNSDFNRLLYDQTDGYQGFSNVTTLPDGVTTFTYEIKGIFLEFGPVATNIKFVVEINGLQTMITLPTSVETTPLEDEITLVLGDLIGLGQINVDNGFLLDMLGNNMSNLGLMTYDSANQSLIIEKEVFDSFMSVGGSSTPLTVDKIRIVQGAFEVIVTYTDPTLGTLIDTVTGSLETVLGTDFVDDTAFDVTDPDQQQAVSDLTETLDEIQTILTDPEQELTPEDTAALVEAINNLDDANQQIFLDQLESSSGSAELLALYDDLFGN